MLDRDQLARCDSINAACHPMRNGQLSKTEEKTDAIAGGHEQGGDL